MQRLRRKFLPLNGCERLAFRIPYATRRTATFADGDLFYRLAFDVVTCSWNRFAIDHLPQQRPHRFGRHFRNGIHDSQINHSVNVIFRFVSKCIESGWPLLAVDLRELLYGFYLARKLCRKWRFWYIISMSKVNVQIHFYWFSPTFRLILRFVFKG